MRGAPRCAAVARGVSRGSGRRGRGAEGVGAVAAVERGKHGGLDPAGASVADAEPLAELRAVVMRPDLERLDR